MALLLIEGFDTYATGGYTGKWLAQGGTISAIGRQGTNGLTYITSTDMEKAVSNKKTVIIGIAIKLSATKSWTLVEFRDSATNQIGLYTDGSNQILVKVGFSTIKSTGYSIPTNTWVYLEFKATIDNTTGSWELRINGVTKDSDSGIDTQATGNAYATSVMFRFSGLGSSTHYLDDIYIFDDEGSFCNDFVGDVHVEALFPEDVGYVTEWVGVPGAGDNYEEVDEIDPDDDSTFVATSGVGLEDSYIFEDLVTLSGSVFAVQINLWGKKDDVGSRTVVGITRPVSTTYSGIGESLGDTYQYTMYQFASNPETATYWTISEVNAAEFGIREEA